MYPSIRVRTAYRLGSGLVLVLQCNAIVHTVLHVYHHMYHVCHFGAYTDSHHTTQLRCSNRAYLVIFLLSKNAVYFGDGITQDVAVAADALNALALVTIFSSTHIIH